MGIMNEILFIISGAVIATILLIIESMTQNYSLGLERPEQKTEFKNPFEDMNDGVEHEEKREWDYEIGDI